MALERYKEIRFKAASLTLIEACADVIDNYLAQGLRLTLRQLYYQLVTQNLIRNEERSYKNLGSLVSDARLAGLLDWEAIEDRVRQPRTPSEWTGPAEIMASVLRAYRLPRWAGQTTYAELWVEKDALAGVLEPLASEHHVTLMVNRGYSSQSAMYESAKRFLRESGTDGAGDVDEPKSMHLFYLGDHDPSGEDMVRDVRERLALFGADVQVEKIALTTAQVRQYNPPPNPAKMSDSRAAAYVREHGRSSWEVDALPPNVLAQIVRTAFRTVIDKPVMDAVKRKEIDQKEKMRALIEEHFHDEE